MLKKHPIIKWSLITLISLIILIVSFGYWFIGLIKTDGPRPDHTNTSPNELPYLTQNIPPSRGKILAVVSSHDVMGSSQKKTGYELTELARPYYVFKANGFEVDIASPKGGNAPMVIDKDDMREYDYAFLNDKEAQLKATNTIHMDSIDREDYIGVYFVGGKGAMYDFPQNKAIQNIVSEYYQNGKMVGAVCHGPAALVNVKLDDGSYLLSGKKVSGFTNEEELFLIPDARTVFPFLLEEQMIEKGANYVAGKMYLKNVCQDGNLVTGQNPWSTWTFAETMVKQLGYESKPRQVSGEENSVEVLLTYENKGYDEAKELIRKMSTNSNQKLDRELLAIHVIVAGMQLKPSKIIDILRLTAFAKEQYEINL